MFQSVSNASIPDPRRGREFSRTTKLSGTVAASSGPTRRVVGVDRPLLFACKSSGPAPP